MQFQVNPQAVLADTAAVTALTSGYATTTSTAWTSALWATAQLGTTVRPAAAVARVYAYRGPAGELVGYTAVLAA